MCLVYAYMTLVLLLYSVPFALAAPVLEYSWTRSPSVFQNCSTSLSTRPYASLPGSCSENKAVSIHSGIPTGSVNKIAGIKNNVMICVASVALFCTLDSHSEGELKPHNKVSVNRGSRSSVVFADRAGAGVRHEESIA